MAGYLQSIITDNATDMEAGMSKLRKALIKTALCGIVGEKAFHALYMALVVNFTVKEFISEIQDKILKIRKLVAVFCFSVESLNLCESVCKELDIVCKLYNLDSRA